MIVVVVAGVLISLIDSEEYPNIGIGCGGGCKRSPPSATGTLLRRMSRAGSSERS
jgi:hypothetical protein